MSPESTATNSPPATVLDSSDMAIFTPTPLSVGRVDGQKVVPCPDCSKPVLEGFLESHQGPAAPDPKKAKTPSLVVVLGDGGDKKKKIKIEKEKLAASSGATAGAAASTSGTTAAKSSSSAKARGPIDPDRHCGVINDKGFPCSRSLTCKTHSMGAKRSVPHRSQPYDILLHEWQKATKGESFLGKKPVQPRVGPGSEGWAAGKDGVEIVGGKRKKDRKEKKEKSGKSMVMFVGEWEESDREGGEGGEYDAAIDSDEEVESMLKALDRIPKGRPLGVFMGGGAGFSSASMWAGRNSKLRTLRETLGGVFTTAGRA
ncbi:hypothetical protein MNV49_001510 [Pseudohyphozyma bogoriensis]|nr:hypothetical protein MNV49_001510 [Pseudohyphozyma bogoriensis]